MGIEGVMIGLNSREKSRYRRIMGNLKVAECFSSNIWRIGVSTFCNSTRLMARLVTQYRSEGRGSSTTLECFLCWAKIHLL